MVIIIDSKVLKTVGDNYQFVDEPWLSHEVGKDFQWENGNIFHITVFGIGD